MSRVWTRAHVQTLAEELSNGPLDPAQVRQDYGPLLYKTTLRLHKDYYYLVFGNSIEDALGLSDGLLAALIGSDHRAQRDSFCAKAPGYIIDRPDCPVKDLSNVDAPYKLVNFNILSQQRGIRVPTLLNNGLIQIPPIVNICIALTMIACMQGRGLFTWTRKKRTQAAGYAHWQRVPDLLLSDYYWKPEDKKAFLEASYTKKRDFLCADNRLKHDSPDVVLPFLVDFPGETLQKKFDARVTADILNGQLGGAISIPGAAYIGWLDQFVPRKNVSDYYREENTNVRGNASGIRREYIVPEEQLDELQVETTLEMYRKAIEMMDQCRDLIFYSKVRAMAQSAREKARLNKESDETHTEDTTQDEDVDLLNEDIGW